MSHEQRTEDRPGEVFHTTVRGVIGAMAMTGMRQLTTALGLVDETPPESILRRQTKGLLRLVPRKRRRVAVTAVHWGVGAVGGLAFGALPDEVRRSRWAGPAWGLVMLAAYQTAVAPALGLKQAKDPDLSEWLGLTGDHLLYGFVLSEFRERPRD
jgi:hypothetical protein